MNFFQDFIGCFSPFRHVVSYRDIKKELISHCPACQANIQENSKPFAKLDRYGFPVSSYWCKSCDLIYINPRPTSNAYKVFYDTGQYRHLITAFSGRDDDHLLPQSRVEQLVSILKHHLPNRSISVLNIGGTPSDYQSLSPYISFSHYVCLNPGTDEAGTGYEIWPYTLESLNATNLTFDLICLFGTLNHLSEPGDSFVKIAKMMGPETIFAFDFKDPLVKMSRMTQPIGGLQFDHATYPTLKALGVLLNRAGLSLIDWHTGNNAVYTFIAKRDSVVLLPEMLYSDQSLLLNELRLLAGRVPIRLFLRSVFSIFGSSK